MAHIEIKPAQQTCEVDPEEFITLVSSDGHAFIVNRECCKASKLIKGYLKLSRDAVATGPEAKHIDVNEDRTEIRFQTINRELLELAIRYFYYKHKYDNDPDVRPEFPVDPKIALDLIRVATTLKC